jgi:heat shock protein HslJ
MKVTIHFALTLLLLFFSNNVYSNNKKKKSTFFDINTLKETTWIFNSFGNDTIIPVPSQAILTFIFIKDSSFQVSGISYVNTFTGDFEISSIGVVKEKFDLTVNELVAPDDNLNTMEAVFMTYLKGVHSMKYEFGKLILNTDNGEMVFVKKK